MPLCMGCMQQIGNNKICPSGGFDNTEKQQAPFLPYGTVLANRYIVGAGIDANGESTRYIGYDKQTGDVIIVCEFLPMGLFTRAEDETELKINYENRLAFKKIKDEFISYGAEKVPYKSHGTGDVYASAFTGSLVSGKSIYDSLVIAADYTTACIRNTYNDPGHVNYAVNFELEIPYLLKLIGK